MQSKEGADHNRQADLDKQVQAIVAAAVAAEIEPDVFFNCPAAALLLVVNHPGGTYYDPNFKSRTEAYLKSQDTKCASLDAKQYFERVADFCRGVDYVYKKFERNGESRKLRLLRQFRLVDKTRINDHDATDNFLAAIQRNKDFVDFDDNDPYYTLIIQSGLFSLHALRDCRVRDRQIQDDKIDGFFNAREMAILTGIEETLHVLQLERGLSTTYDAGRLMSESGADSRKSYEDDPMELEVKDVLEEAARELKLGSIHGRPMGMDTKATRIRQ